jgi:hypothetical protein
MAKKSNNKNLRYALTAIGAAVVILIIIVIVKSPTTQNPNAGDSLAPSSIVNDLVSLKNSTIQAVGVGTSTAKPTPISGPTIAQNGKPTFLFEGAEYCPYCATERWPMVIALTRFGTFSGLKETHSSSTDVYPDTQTFSFYGSTYSSPYINFEPVERYSNIPSGSGYTTLNTPTSEQQSLMNTYDSPPYVPSSDAGAIPFMYFGGKYILSGASYSPSVLQGKTYSQIASSLSNTKDSISQGMLGTANALTAILCSLTKNQPSSVCTSSIQSIENTFAK